MNKLASDTFTKGALRKEEMKKIDSELIKEKLKQPWLSYKDIYQIYPVGEKEARKMFNAAKEKANGCWMPNRYAPRDIVLELYPIRHKKRIARTDSSK